LSGKHVTLVMCSSQRAIVKYGIESFIFEMIDYGENYNELEKNILKNNYITTNPVTTIPLIGK